MTSNSDLYIQLTRPARKHGKEDTVVTTIHKQDRVANQWRNERWGALKVNITDDPNFEPTETIELPVVHNPVDLSKPMSQEDALTVLNELF